MNLEREVKLLDVDVQKIKEKLRVLGARKIAERNMRRYVFDISPDKPKSWIRLRDNGLKTTLTVKEWVGGIAGAKEFEVEVSDFEATRKILEELGFPFKAYQENRRISYELDGVQVEIDFWPMIPPYVEVEAETEDEIEKVVKLLGFTMEQTSTLQTVQIYKAHGLDIYSFKELKFE